MALKTTPVSRSLERKLLLFGFEALDALLIFMVLSVLNLLFGKTGLKIPLVWLPTATLALILRLGKRGKPERFLVHWLRFQFKPGIYSAFPSPTHSGKRSPSLNTPRLKTEAAPLAPSAPVAPIQPASRVKAPPAPAPDQAAASQPGDTSNFQKGSHS